MQLELTQGVAQLKYMQCTTILRCLPNYYAIYSYILKYVILNMFMNFNVWKNILLYFNRI